MLISNLSFCLFEQWNSPCLILIRALGKCSSPLCPVYQSPVFFDSLHSRSSLPFVLFLFIFNQIFLWFSAYSVNIVNFLIYFQSIFFNDYSTYSIDIVKFSKFKGENLKFICRKLYMCCLLFFLSDGSRLMFTEKEDKVSVVLYTWYPRRN